MLRDTRLLVVRIVATAALALTSLPPGDLRAAGTITGAVFQDFNGNGVRDLTATAPTAGGFGTAALAVDRGIPGVTVTAFDMAGTAQGLATSAADGSYVLNAGGSGPYRIEFSTLPPGFFPGPHGSGNATTVQFVPDGASVANLGVVKPADYGQNDPPLVTNVYVFGDHATGPNASVPVLGSFPTTAGAAHGAPIPDPNPNIGGPDSGGGPYLVPQTHALLVPASQIGSTWGLAYNRVTSTIYAAAFTKKFADHGPSGMGAIYQTGATGNTAALFADLNQIFGAGTAGPEFRDTPTWIAQGGFYADGFNTGWDAVGKTALGGLDISPDGRFLYAVGLADTVLYVVPTSGPLNASTVSRVPIPNPITPATSLNPALDLRAFAVAHHDGKIYVGAINSAESTQDRNNLMAYVLVFDPATGVFAPTPVLQFPLNYERGLGNAFSLPPSSANWLPWTPVFRNLATANQFDNDTIYPQPWLTGLAFAADGTLVLGLRDRTGDQVGVQTPDDPANPMVLRRGIALGDTLRAAFDAGTGTFTLESNATVGGVTTTGSGNGQGPGGGEFYFDDDTPGPGGAIPVVHNEMSVGGVLQLPGYPDVATTTINPILVRGYFSRGGLRWFSNATGGLRRAYEIYYSGPVSTAAITFSKANGVGDLVALADPPPVEIGNRVWLDANQNGLQDAAELPLVGVTVRLYDAAGTLLATTTTDTNGAYYFTRLVPGPTTYSVRLDNPADVQPGGALFGLVPTVALAGAAHIDSNGVATPGVPGVTSPVTVNGPGQNDHTIDFGFYAGADIDVMKLVDPAGPPGGSIRVLPGVPVSFWFKVVNHGPAPATGVVLTELLPPGLRLVNFGATQGTFDPTTGIWTVGDLAVGAMATMDLAAIPEQMGPLVNTLVRTAGPPPDPNPTNDASSGTFIVTTEPDITVRGLVVPSLLPSGVADAVNPTVTMRFEARNLGPVAVAATRFEGAVTTSDGLPGLTVIGVVPSQGNIDGAAWDVGPLAPGATATVDVTSRLTRQMRAHVELHRTTTSPPDGDVSNDRGVVTVEGVGVNGGGRYLAFASGAGTTGLLVVGPSEREGSLVRAFDAAGAQSLAFQAQTLAVPGGVRLASCDIDRDGRDDFVVGAGLPGGGAQVRIFSRTVSGAVVELASWNPLGPDYRGGVYVACADLDGDTVPDVVTGSGAEGPAIIQAWKPSLPTRSATELGRVSVGGILPGYGVRVAACDTTGDGRAEVLTAPVGGSAPIVRVFSSAGQQVGSIAAAQSGEARGLQVACGNILPGAGNEILVGLELGGSPIARAFTAQGAFLGEYLGFAPAPGAGVRVAIGEFDGKPLVQEFALASGSDAAPEVVVGSVQAGVAVLLRFTPPPVP